MKAGAAGAAALWVPAGTDTCLQVSLRYVLPVAMICAIILYHGTK